MKIASVANLDEDAGGELQAAEADDVVVEL
jgi:hypothetical protein